MPQEIVELRVALKPIDDIDKPPNLKNRMGAIDDVLKVLRKQLEAKIKTGLMIVGFGPPKEKKEK